MKGWIKLHRQISSSDLWKSEKFTRGQAWVDLILLANHKSGFIRARGIKIDVKRGQVGTSQDTLSKRWGWSRGKVLRFLNELEMEQQIVQQKNNVSSLLSIVNYDEYQSNDTANSTANGQQTVQQTNTNKNVKNKKNEEEEYSKHNKSEKVILDYLNERTGKKYRVAKGLKSRLTEGYTIEDAMKVIDIKCDEWLGCSKMKTFLRPETLFSNKFDSYLNQDVVEKDFSFKDADWIEMNNGEKVKVDFKKKIVFNENGNKHEFLEVDENGVIFA